MCKLCIISEAVVRANVSASTESVAFHFGYSTLASSSEVLHVVGVPQRSATNIEVAGGCLSLSILSVTCSRSRYI